MFPASGRYFRALFKQKKSPFHQVFEVTSLCLRGTLQRREKKRMVRHEVRSTIKIHHYIRLVCETRAKIPSSDPETSLTTGRFLFWGRSRRLYGNYKSSQSSGSSRNFLKRLRRSGRSYGNQGLSGLK